VVETYIVQGRDRLLKKRRREKRIRNATKVTFGDDDRAN